MKSQCYVCAIALYMLYITALSASTRSLQRPREGRESASFSCFLERWLALQSAAFFNRFRPSALQCKSRCVARVERDSSTVVEDAVYCCFVHSRGTRCAHLVVLVKVARESCLEKLRDRCAKLSCDARVNAYGCCCHCLG